jgi:putative transposase
VRVAKGLKKPTTRPNQLWQTDFTYFKLVGWGWYYLSLVLDGFSCYTRSVACKFTPTMGATDVQDTHECALARTKLEKVRGRREHETAKTSNLSGTVRPPLTTLQAPLMSTGW